MRYIVGADGIRIGSGIGPFLGINVAVPVATVNPPAGSVFLNPTGVVNAGSFAPFTAPWVPGELLTLYGANMAPSPLTIAPQVPFPTTLDGVQVMVNGVAAPIYYTTPGQISAIVPYAANTAVVQIQVVNNGAASNVATNLSGQTAPGVLTQSQNGYGYGDVEHGDGSLVTPANPARIGETVAVYLTGLGAVYPTIPDGSAGPASPPSQTTSTITAYLDSTSTSNSVQATVGYAGLAPELPALYQLNLTIPSGATAGDNYLELLGPDSDSFVSLIPIAGSSTASGASTIVRARPNLRGRRTASPSLAPSLMLPGRAFLNRDAAGHCSPLANIDLKAPVAIPAAEAWAAKCR
jgi:uncharacterized protein (TIGR03437 family)